MLWRNIGYLCREIEQTDALGKPFKTFVRTMVFCNEKGVKRSEFYQAQAQGYKPELCIELKACDYSKEGHFEYDGIMYRIIRTYPVKNECIELTCQALVNDD